MKKVICTFCVLTLGVMSALAAQYHFLSSSLVSYSAAPSTQTFTTMSSYSLQGQVFGYNLSYGRTKPYGGNFGEGTSGSVTVQMKVWWEPSYVGEPAPTGGTAGWSYQQHAEAVANFWAPGPTGGGSINQIVQQAWDPGLVNINWTQAFAPPPIHGPSNDATGTGDLGAFSFQTENVKWVGTATFTTTLSASITSYSVGSAGAGNGQSQTLTLYSVAGVPLT